MNQDGIRVSVIMIFLNAERFMREAIESVLAQTYDYWELVLVDDGSSDGSTDIALEHVRRYPDRMRYHQHPGHENRGMSASRNLGIYYARGHYIGFLDADDIYLPGKLAHHVALLDQQPETDMMYGATQYWYSWTGKLEDQRKDRLRRQGVPSGTVVHPPDLLLPFLQDEVRTPTTCGVLIRRGTIDRVGGFEEDFRGMYEDQIFFTKMFLHATIYIDDVCGDRYRQHPNSTVSLMRSRGDWHPSARPTAARKMFFEWLDHYLTQSDLTDPRVKTVLETELQLYRHPYLSLPRHITRIVRRRQTSLGKLARRARQAATTDWRH